MINPLGIIRGIVIPRIESLESVAIYESLNYLHYVVTVTLTDALAEPLTAVMSAEPLATPVITPSSTVATVSSELVHVMSPLTGTV